LIAGRFCGDLKQMGAAALRFKGRREKFCSESVVGTKWMKLLDVILVDRRYCKLLGPPR
jgi:hypothetical protein